MSIPNFARSLNTAAQDVRAVRPGMVTSQSLPRAAAQQSVPSHGTDRSGIAACPLRLSRLARWRVVSWLGGILECAAAVRSALALADARQRADGLPAQRRILDTIGATLSSVEDAPL